MCIGGEAFQLVELTGVVNEEARLLAIVFLKVLGRDLQGFGHPFADGDAGHHDDELAPAVLPVQLEHGLDVAIGLAGAGFHLDIQMQGRESRLQLLHLGLQRCLLALVADGMKVLQRGRQGQMLAALHGLDVGQQLLIAQGDVRVAKGVVQRGLCEFGLVKERCLHGGGIGAALPGVVPIADPLGPGLSSKAVEHGLHGGALVVLGLELELHGWARRLFCALMNP